jgi:hypothetical protein
MISRGIESGTGTRASAHVRAWVAKDDWPKK